MTNLKQSQSEFAKILVAACVRRGFLEQLHAGVPPVTYSGDWSDVRVIDAAGREIPWSEVSRISDDEMGLLISGIVNRVHTFLARTLFSATEDQAFFTAISRAARPWIKGWREPQFLANFLMPWTDEPR
jgi:hypothetical protein